MAEQQEREAAASAAQEQLQAQFNSHVQSFPINLPFPATVESSDPEKKLRTKRDLIQHRLLESGVLFEDTQTVGQVTEAVANLVENLQSTACFNAVQVKLQDNSNETEKEKQELKVVLNEKNWYRLYIGGGLKQEGLIGNNTGSDNLFPKVQFETTGGLVNLTGNLDQTSLGYTIDQTSISTVLLTHDRPLFSLFREDGSLHDTILSLDKGSQINLGFRAVLDTIDHEWTRSYKEYQRLVSCRISNVATPNPEMTKGSYHGMEWQLVMRDVVPRRHASLPYALDCSNEIASQAVPSLKHSLVYENRSNGDLCNDRYNPTAGVDYHGRLEVAGPPGDVGFVKIQGGSSLHLPVLESIGLALHASINTGLLHPLDYGGLCSGSTSISDRFFIGGPLQLRGFVPAGIGPRASRGGASTPGGDALGGDFFYTTSLAASIPFPAIAFLQNNGVRLFGFCNTGTLVSTAAARSGGGIPMVSILKSTRASAGGGIAIGTALGRLEATYAVPIRYGPRDARRSVQFGLGFSFG